MNKLLTLALVMLISLGAIAQDEVKEKQEGYVFTDTKVIPHTSVKSQYRSGTCWSFSAISFIEAELMRTGKGDIDLSEMFAVHHTYYDKSIQYVRMHGNLNYGAGAGFGDVFHVIKEYGMTTEEAYNGLNYGTENHVHGEMDAMLLAMVQSVIKDKNRTLTPVWPTAIKATINTYLGPIPEDFEYDGKKVTPRAFADNIMEFDYDDYVFLTSYSHHPFYEEFAVEVPDNWALDLSYNLPLNELMQVIDNAIENDMTVAWAADVSEKGFKWSNGYAVVPETDIKNLSDLEQAKWEDKSAKEIKEGLLSAEGPAQEKEITQEVRQMAYDNYQTTDDHGMHIVGIAKDQNGNLYYKIKNSWGVDQKYDGYFYASKAFVEYKTMDIVIHKDALPKDIKKKLGL
ncbi:MAG: aminopeptidase [Bacteroidetes bacterium]|nr:MAG: aminopeptidase [Bacteroidota bacterium]